MTDLRSDETLDLRGVLCPVNFVQVKLALEEMAEGQLLEVVLDCGDPIRSVPRSVKEEGHRVVSVEQLDDQAYRLFIRKG